MSFRFCMHSYYPMLLSTRHATRPHTSKRIKAKAKSGSSYLLARLKHAARDKVLELQMQEPDQDPDSDDFDGGGDGGDGDQNHEKKDVRKSILIEHLLAARPGSLFWLGLLCQWVKEVQVALNIYLFLSWSPGVLVLSP